MPCCSDPEKELIRRQRLSDAHKGRKKNPESAAKSAIGISKSMRLKYQDSKKMDAGGDWRHNAWRKAVLSRDENCCRFCGSNIKLHTHHIKSWIEFPLLRYDIDNGVTACQKCHYSIHGKIIPPPNQNTFIINSGTLQQGGNNHFIVYKTFISREGKLSSKISVDLQTKKSSYSSHLEAG